MNTIDDRDKSSAYPSQIKSCTIQFHTPAPAFKIVETKDLGPRCQYEIPPSNENQDTCAKCGGYCCANFGCELDPADFIRKFGAINEKNVRIALDSGNYAIDWWNGDIRLDYPSLYDESPFEPFSQSYYLRTRHVNEGAVCGSWGGRCVCLTDTGCKFSWEERPRGGREKPVGTLSEPYDKTGCHYSEKLSLIDVFGKPMAAYLWLPYYDILDAIAKSGDYTEDLLSAIWLMEDKEE